jgi:signal transduction histidine kinase
MTGPREACGVASVDNFTLTATQLDQLAVGALRCRWDHATGHYHIEFVNQSYLRGIPEPLRGRVNGGAPADYLPPEAIATIYEHFDRARADGVSVCPSLAIAFEGDATRWYRWTAVGDPADPDRVTAIIVDVTAAQELADARRTMLLRELQAIDHVRGQLAAELHDGVIQSLTELTLRLASTSDPSELQPIVQRAIRQCRALIRRVRPPTPVGGASPAIEQLVEEWRVAGLIDIAIEGPRLPSLGPDRDVLLYLVERELLVNAMEHAAGAHVRLRREIAEDRLVVTIADTGPGMTHDARAAARGDGHLGLALVEERVRELGGRLRIESEPGAGTTVVLEVTP